MRARVHLKINVNERRFFYFGNKAASRGKSRLLRKSLAGALESPGVVGLIVLATSVNLISHNYLPRQLKRSLIRRNPLSRHPRAAAPTGIGSP